MGMRENRTFKAKMPETRNAFIDCVKNKSTVIVLKNSLIASMDKELNDNKSNKGAKKIIGKLGKASLIIGIIDPLVWIYSLACFVVGGVLKDDIKGYDVYCGEDVNGKNIIVLIRKKDYNPKYDTINYDRSYVKSVAAKPMRGKIKA